MRWSDDVSGKVERRCFVGQDESMLYWNRLGSTLDCVEQKVDEACKKGAIWIRAAEQTQGKGQWGRSFISPRGGLYCTLIVPWSCAAPLCFVSVLTALAIADVLPVDCRIQWVNDLYVQSRKICGVLIESRISSCAQSVLCISFGLNVNVDPDLIFDGRATSLKHILGYSVDIHHLFSKIRYGLYQRIEQIFTQKMQDILNDLYPMLWGWQEKVCVTTMNKKKFEGVWTGIDADTGQVVLNSTTRHWARSITSVPVGS